MKIAYLSCPYSHPDPKVKQQRHAIVNQAAYHLMQQGVMVYSPLTHNVPIDNLGIHGNWMTWKDFDHGMLSRCDYMIVLKLAGWEESKGVAAEMEQAKHLGIPIEWMDPKEEYLKILKEQTPQQEILEKILACYAERDWEQFHSPKNLAMNLGVEVGELMEHFRWLTEAQSYIKSHEDLNEIQDEIGDVFIVLLHLSHTLGIDLSKSAHQKLDKLAQKYPVEKCKGLNHKYTKYLRDKTEINIAKKIDKDVEINGTVKWKGAKKELEML